MPIDAAPRGNRKVNCNIGLEFLGDGIRWENR